MAYQITTPGHLNLQERCTGHPSEGVFVMSIADRSDRLRVITAPTSRVPTMRRSPSR
jgi:hypothetical protein